MADLSEKKPVSTPRRKSSSAAALQGASPAEVKSLSAAFGLVDIKAGNIGAGAGGGFGLNAPGTGPKPKSFAGSAKPSGFAVAEDVVTEWNKMLDDKDPTHFVIARYTDNYKGLELSSSGEGRLGAFKEALKAYGEDKIAWGGFRCYGVDDRGNTVSKRAKIVFVQYMPPNAPAMKKAKMGSQKGSVKAKFDKAHMDVLVENPDEDLVKEDLVTKLQAATGAHKVSLGEERGGERGGNGEWEVKGKGSDARPRDLIESAIIAVERFATN